MASEIIGRRIFWRSQDQTQQYTGTVIDHESGSDYAWVEKDNIPPRDSLRWWVFLPHATLC